MLISGKISVGVRSSTTGVSRMMASASTINVYGLASASRTIHISVRVYSQAPIPATHPKIPGAAHLSIYLLRFREPFLWVRPKMLRQFAFSTPRRDKKLRPGNYLVGQFGTGYKKYRASLTCSILDGYEPKIGFISHQTVGCAAPESLSHPMRSPNC